MLSLNRPIAVKASAVPAATVCPDGLTDTDTIVASVTSRVVEVLMDPSIALMVVDPGVRALNRPVLAIVATVALDELQETFPVKF